MVSADGRRRAGEKLQRGEVERDGTPEDEEEGQRAEVFREHDVPVAHRRGEQHLDRAEFELLREDAHGDERDLDEQQHPEERPGEENLHHALLGVVDFHHLAGDEEKLDALRDGAAEEHDVGDTAVKIAAEFAFI
jgi:hypothetical protein